MARASRTSQARARGGQNAVRHVRNGDCGRQGDLDGADEVGFDIELPMFTVGRAGELANVHPQTLRQYDRLGLVVRNARTVALAGIRCETSRALRKRSS